MTGLLERAAPTDVEDVVRHVDAQPERWIELLREFIQRPSRTGHVDEVTACGERAGGTTA